MIETIKRRAFGSTYHMARAFGRGRLFSAWLHLRYLCTGRTGNYRIY